MGDVQILGVISRDAEEPRLAYPDEAMPAAPETLELAAPLDVSQVFRLSARCEEKKCTHFDGSHCQRPGLRECFPKWSITFRPATFGPTAAGSGRRAAPPACGARKS
jgi:hypothetical protein